MIKKKILSTQLDHLYRYIESSGEMYQFTQDVIICYPKQIPFLCFFLEKGSCHVNFHRNGKKEKKEAPSFFFVKELAEQSFVNYSLKIDAGSICKTLPYSLLKKHLEN